MGWRSDMTAELMREFCDNAGLEVISQFASWDTDRFRVWPTLPPEEGPDTVTLLQKPAR